jgi:hypothetical protein
VVRHMTNDTAHIFTPDQPSTRAPVDVSGPLPALRYTASRNCTGRSSDLIAMKSNHASTLLM